MASVLKISEAASIALHTACFMAPEPQRLYTTREMAAGLGVSEAHLSKVLQRLTRAEIVRSVRGPKGGFRLNRPPVEVSLKDVFEAIEGTMDVPDCLLGRRVCTGNCLLGSLLGDLDGQVRDYFSGTTIQDLVGTFRRSDETAATHNRD